MEELKKFFQLLFRNRLILIIVPLFSIIITYFLVHNLPNEYVSQAELATGIVDESQNIGIGAQSDNNEQSVSRKFSNLIQLIKLKRIVDQVSYRLIIQDLSSDSTFRKPSKAVIALSPQEKQRALEVFKRKYSQKASLNLRNPEENKLHELLVSMEYDEESIESKLTIYRTDVSDFITVVYTSENPELSAFIANTLCSEFINYNTIMVSERNRNAVNFLDSLLTVKSDTLKKRVEDLRLYKVRNHVLNLEEQSGQMFSQIGKYQDEKQQAEKDLISLRGTIANIDKKFDPTDRRYFESIFIKMNQDIEAAQNQYKSVSDAYINSGFDETNGYVEKMDSLKSVIDVQVANYSKEAAYNPSSTKQALINQKLTLQTQYDMTLYGLSSINKALNELNGKFNSLVPHEAVIQSYDRQIDIASKEYLDINDKFNQTSMESGISTKVRQVQLAMPGAPKPSKKMLLIILSGVISLVFCIVVFFVIFYLDNNITSPKELAQGTEVPVLGHLNMVGISSLDLKDLWKNLHNTPEMEEYKRQLRSTRFEVNQELVTTSAKQGQVLSITSLSGGEGKTLVAASIAYSYVVISKKVLLIDGNFENPSITNNSNTKLFIEDYIKYGQIDTENFTSGIMVMGNQGGDKSLLEVSDEETIRARFDYLKNQFDVILIETPSLDALSKAKEWILFSDKILGIFEANQALTESKKQQINYLKSLNGKFMGWILNKVKPATATKKALELQSA